MQEGRAGGLQSCGGQIHRWTLAFLALILCATLIAAPAEARRYASIVIDAQTGTILHEDNLDRKVYPASLTKMMTLYLLFEHLDKGVFSMDQKLKVSRRAAGQPQTNLSLRTGDRISVEDAIYALIIRSANDVATVVAEAIGETESKFARMMTKKARELGMADTVFRNASGLPNRAQVTTVRDMATLARALMQDFPHYYDYFSALKFTYGGKTYETHNNVLTRYDGVDGLKTGYISASGFNVATSVIRDGRRLIAVVVGGRTARSRDDHMIALLDRSFAKADSIPIYVAGAAPENFVVPGRKPEPPTSILSAAVAALAPAAVAAETDGPMAGPWGIQVGAFSQFEPAHRVATKAAESAEMLLRDARVVVHERAKNSRRLYRARIIGLSEKDARAACRLLESKKMPCLVVRLDLSTAMSRQ
ncbi:D-alanyl-D-alanine carboxypeptidase [Rhodospirillaceae bacterium SYSU D60014]|uniref:serine hydrolase n=1 Tax=Virgifigura deserti TaxID=2268457 RepID=UPI000E669A6C